MNTMIRDDYGPRWAAALDDFEDAKRDDGYYSNNTLANVLKRLRRLAREGGIADPWKATTRQLERWLDHLPVKASEIYPYRTALRTFYRWGLTEGRITIDPMEPIWARLQAHEASAEWMAALRDFRAFLRTQRASRQTVALRMSQLIRCGREIGREDPWQVTEDDLVDWLGAHTWGRATAKSHRAAVRSFYRWAVRTGRVQANPADILPTIREQPAVPRPASETAVRHALSAAAEREGLMVRLAAELGLRRGEVCKVHRRDLTQDDRGTWWLYVLGKGDKVRRLPVPDGLAAAIAQHDGYLFPGQIQGHLSPQHVGKLIAGLLPPGSTMHTLRHRFATQAYGVTNDILSVQQLLGHASPTTTQRYVAVPADNLRRLVTAVAL